MLKIQQKKWKKISLYLITISCFAYYYERFRETRKIPRLQRVQINFSNWILSKTKKLPACPPPPPSRCSEEKQLAPRPLFKIQLPLRARDCIQCCYCTIMAQSIELTNELTLSYDSDTDVGKLNTDCRSWWYRALFTGNPNGAPCTW